MTVIVTKNKKPMERRYFLLRGLRKGNITQEQYDKEMPALEATIAVNLAEKLEESKKQMQADLEVVKKTIPDDGNMKRACGKILIKFLKEHFTDKEIKGIFRQGYKLMRL